MKGETPDYTDTPFEPDYLEQLAVAATRQRDLELANELIDAADYKRKQDNE
jgi:GT2 family glycosyltransferase